MVSSRNASILVPLLLPALGAWTEARPQSGGKVFARHDGPLRSVALDLGTGTLTRGPTASDRTSSTVLDFTDTDLAGFVGVDTGGGFCTWVDAATKGQVSGNASDLMNNVVFAYCSSAQSPGSGGPGGSVQLGFYEGYAVGGGPSTSVGLFNVTGLPGLSSSSSFPRFACYYASITFPGVVAFADGNIGYSWGFTSLGTTGVLANTFPFLACVQSCSGTGPDGQGMVDQLDQYCPPGTLLQTFSFGTTPSGSYFTSMSMDIRELVDLESVASSWNSQMVNVDTLGSNAVTVGGNWTVTVDVDDAHGTGATQPMALTVRTSCVNGANAVSPLGGRPVELLINGPLALKLTGTHGPMGTTAAFPTFAVPMSAALCGGTWAAQATVVGGGGRGSLERALRGGGDGGPGGGSVSGGECTVGECTVGECTVGECTRGECTRGECTAHSRRGCAPEARGTRRCTRRAAARRPRRVELR